MPPKAMNLDRNSARRILEKSIADGLTKVIGPAGLKLVAIEIPPEEAAENPKKLHEVLVSIFMERGTMLIEREIAQRLLDRLGKMDISPGMVDKLPEGEPAHGDAHHQVELLREFAKTAGLPGRPRHSSDSMDSTAESFAEAFTTGR